MEQLWSDNVKKNQKNSKKP